MKSWKYTILGPHIDLLSGYAFKSERYSPDEADVKLLRGDNIVQGQLRWDGVQRWPQSETGLLRRYELADGDVVLAMDRTWVNAGLKCSRVKERDLPCLLVQRVARLRGGCDLDSSFLYQTLQTHHFVQYVKGVQTETAIPHISSQQIREFPIQLPPLPEQQKIAAILSTWDRAIELTEKLITAKQKRKQALMSQLLTGKVRFAELSNRKWREVKLGKLFIERREPGFLDLPLLSITANEGIVYRDTLERKDNSNADKSKYLRICVGDIGYNTMRMWQGVSALSGHEGIVSPAYTICTPCPDIDPVYMSHLFKYPPIVHVFWRYSQGMVDDTLNLKFSAFSTIKVCVPGRDEQEKIGKVLVVMDKELSFHARQVEQLRTQKKGLMQQLLTGKVRVNVDTEKVNV